MSKTGMPARVISALLAAVLACTMIPSTSIAFAASADDEITSVAGEQAQIEASEGAEAESDNPDGEAGSIETIPAATERVNEDVPVAAQDSESAAEDIASDDSTEPSDLDMPTTDELDMLNTSVSLNGAGTVLVNNGLTYQVNTADPTTVALTGWAGAAPKDALYIPTQVVVGSTTYKVTAVNKLPGGGSAL